MSVKRMLIALAFAAGAFGAPAFAQSWAWAVYHNGDEIVVANMASPPDRTAWTPVSPCTYQSQVQAQGCACVLVTKGDLMNRKYHSTQIAKGEWSCPKG